jgi:hypothetical protein
VKYADGQQGVAQDDRRQDQPADRKRARQSQEEGPAAYAPDGYVAGGTPECVCGTVRPV